MYVYGRDDKKGGLGLGLDRCTVEFEYGHFASDLTLTHSLPYSKFDYPTARSFLPPYQHSLPLPCSAQVQLNSLPRLRALLHLYLYCRFHLLGWICTVRLKCGVGSAIIDSDRFRWEVKRE